MDEIEGLVEQLSSGDMRLRVEAARSLGEIGDARGVGPLVRLLKGEESQARGAAVEALGRIGDLRAIEALLPLLENDTAAGSAVVALGKIGDARAIGPMAKLVARQELVNEFWARTLESSLCEVLRRCKDDASAEDLRAVASLADLRYERCYRSEYGAPDYCSVLTHFLFGPRRVAREELARRGLSVE